MATKPDKELIATFVNKTARPLFNYRMGRGAQSATGTIERRIRGGLTRQRKAEQELHDAIMDYAMTYAVHHKIEVT